MIEPIKKKKSNIKKIVLGSFLGILIGSLIGTTYALYTYSNTGTNNKLVVGDIYMKYKGNNELDFEEAMPSTTYTEGKYFEFEVSGKNTTTNKDIYYDIVLNHGVENPKTRTTRLDDKFLMFRLVEVENYGESNETENEVITPRSFNTINNTRIYKTTINKNTTSEVKHIYRLYAWISNDVRIGNVEQDYTESEWKDVYASISVTVTGDFTDKEVYRDTFNSVVRTHLTENNSVTDEDNVTYISGCSDEETIDGTRCTTENKIDFNFVWYSGKLWRITAIYPNGEMKLITENPITAIYWGENGTYNTSYVRTWLNNDFKDTLENQNNVLISNNNNFVWNATETTETTKETTKASVTTDTVGMLDAYEYTKSYEKTRNNSDKGYLNIKQEWWLITPYSSPYVRLVRNYGGLANYSSSSIASAVRPCIYLSSSITFDKGEGTRNNPYLIGEDMSVSPANAKINTRVSGEYVTFKNELFRIVGIENETTKIVKADYIMDGSQVMRKNATYIYGSGTSDTTWDNYLNNIWITNEDKNLLEQGTYYLGKNDDNNKDYRLTKYTDASCNNLVSDTYTGYVGLLRVGEMFSSQLKGSPSSYQDMWLITPYSSYGSSSVRYVSYNGGLSAFDPSNYTYAVRPTVHLKSNIIIAPDNTGDGTEQHPYTLAIGPTS